jgi:hypothetical protein
MKCVVCKKGETKGGTTTMTLEKTVPHLYSRTSMLECALRAAKRT